MTALLEAQPQAIRPGVQALSFQVMRWLGRAQALRAQLARKAPPPAADALLCSALALCWSDDFAPYPAFTLVDQTVEAARQNKDTRAQANFVNACLRRFLREREALIQLTDADPLARWNHPCGGEAIAKGSRPGLGGDIDRLSSASAYDVARQRCPNNSRGLSGPIGHGGVDGKAGWRTRYRAE